MLGPVKFVIDNYPKVFKTVSSLETNFIHGDDSMSVILYTTSMYLCDSISITETISTIYKCLNCNISFT